MIFKVIVDDEDFLKKYISHYNNMYNTNFDLIEIHDWEVTFASIESNRAGNDEILKWSIQYGKSSIRNQLGIFK